MVLGFGYWHDKLGGERDVLNQRILVNGQPFTIVGIAPRGFDGTTLGQDPDVYVPMSFKPRLTPNWDGADRAEDYWIYLFVGLYPAWDGAQASAAATLKDEWASPPARAARRGFAARWCAPS